MSFAAPACLFRGGIVSNTLFLIPDRTAFLEKIRESFPQEYLRTVLRNADRGGTEGTITTPLLPPFNWHAPFAWLVTRHERYAVTARRSILHFAAQLRERELFREGQIDHWVGAIPVARVLMYYTWVRDSGAFSMADTRYIEQVFTDYLYLNVYQSTRLKALHDGNNQTAALVISCIIMGYILGQLIDRRASAQMVCRYGFERLGPLLGSMPRTGYTGEGSTYMAVVAAPSLALLDASLEYITGGCVTDTRFLPDGSNIHDLLEMNYRCITPSGFLLPWDHYDYVPALGAASLAWLARRNRPDLLGLIGEHGLFEYNHEVMWGGDDQVLAAVFWPNLSVEPHQFYDWIHPEAGGALYGGAETGLYAFQMWDECGGGNPVRRQANPNSLVFEIFGVPFLMDGTPGEGCDRFSVPGTEFRNQDGLAYNFGYGTFAAHNIVIVERDEFHCPSVSAAGYGMAGTVQGQFPAVRGNVTSFYRDYADVVRVERTTVRVSAYTVAVVDDVHFSQDHDFEARFFLRGIADWQPDERKSGFFQTTVHGVSMYFFPDAMATVESEVIQGYPRVFESCSTRVGVRASGSRCRIINIFSGSRAVDVSAPEVSWSDQEIQISDEAGIHRLRTNEIPHSMQAFTARSETLQVVDCSESKPGTSMVPPPPMVHPRAAVPVESAHDRCYAAAAANPDGLEPLLRTLLYSDSWEDQLAAVDCAAHEGVSAVSGILLGMLEEEAGVRYGNIYSRYVWLREGKPGSVSDRCEWRLKTALCRAMGTLRIHDSKQLLQRILQGDDHSAVHQACRDSIDALNRNAAP